MKIINREEGTTFIFSTHDVRVIKMADKVIYISDGELIRTKRRNGSSRTNA